MLACPLIRVFQRVFRAVSGSEVSHTSAQQVVGEVELAQRPQAGQLRRQRLHAALAQSKPGEPLQPICQACRPPAVPGRRRLQGARRRLLDVVIYNRTATLLSSLCIS